MAKDVDSVELVETDMSATWPGPQADWLLDRTQFELRNVLGGVRVHRETWGPSAVLVANVVLRQGLVPAAFVVGVAWVVAAPAAVTVIAASAVLVVHGVLGFVMTERAAARQRTHTASATVTDGSSTTSKALTEKGKSATDPKVKGKQKPSKKNKRGKKPQS